MGGGRHHRCEVARGRGETRLQVVTTAIPDPVEDFTQTHSFSIIVILNVFKSRIILKNHLSLMYNIIDQ